MFTGIVEEIGQVAAVRLGSKSSVLTIRGAKIFDDLQIGDSVATNGVCLTVTHIENHCFQADVMNETLKRSTLGGLRAGNPVNLERAMAANGRFGGHFVSGHVDGTGLIRRVVKDENAMIYTIQADQNILRYIVKKGSIAVDGISLTVVDVTKDSFCVSIIPHTSKQTILNSKRPGGVVNLENDMIGKYIEKFTNQPEKIDEGLLKRYGF